MKAETNKKGNENVLTRIDPNFKKEMDEIKQARIDSGIDENKVSDRTITKFIPKWGSWEKLKEDLITLNIKRRTQ